METTWMPCCCPSHGDCRLHQYIYAVDATSKKKSDEGGPWVRPTQPGQIVTVFWVSLVSTSLIFSPPFPFS